MGLAFKPSNSKKFSAASWSYSGFGDFRDRLAKEIGITLDEMEGFEGHKSWRTVKDPIKPLLNHSDCEGLLTYKQCLQVAPRLKELVSSWEDCYDKEKALILADDMLKCGEERKSLIFC